MYKQEIQFWDSFNLGKFYSTLANSDIEYQNTAGSIVYSACIVWSRLRFK